jgi:hypothetical protein
MSMVVRLPYADCGPLDIRDDAHAGSLRPDGAHSSPVAGRPTREEAGGSAAGTTTLAAALAEHVGAVHLSLDIVEDAMLRAGRNRVGAPALRPTRPSVPLRSRTRRSVGS